MLDLLHPHLSPLQIAWVSVAALTAVLVLAWRVNRWLDRRELAAYHVRAVSPVFGWDEFTWDWPPPPRPTVPVPRSFYDVPAILRNGGGGSGARVERELTPA